MIKIKELIHNILKKPIVYPTTFLSKLIIAVIFWVLLLIFMVFYTPFNLSNIGKDKHLQSMIYSSITVLILFITMLIYPVFDKEATKKGGFTNRKYLVLMIVTTVIIYIANHIYNRLFNEYNNTLDVGINYFILLLDVVYFPAILVANIVDWEVREIVIIDLPKVPEKKSEY